MKPSESNSEWLTRKRLIEPKLKAAGWKIVPFSAQNDGPCAIEDETANIALPTFEQADGNRILGTGRHWRGWWTFGPPQMCEIRESTNDCGASSDGKLRQ